MSPVCVELCVDEAELSEADSLSSKQIERVFASESVGSRPSFRFHHEKGQIEQTVLSEFAGTYRLE